MFTQNVLPRFRGFNLPDPLVALSSNWGSHHAMKEYCPEWQFQTIADWGFDFARIPMSYRIWSSVEDPFRIDEEKIAFIDRIVENGIKHGVHVNLCLHRVPGYCVNDDEPIKEPFNFFYDKEAQEATAAHWSAIAKRYVDIGNDKLSFNIVNEPHWDLPGARSAEATRFVEKAIRAVSPDRLILLDGNHNGSMPPLENLHMQAADAPKCAYSCRGYSPGNLTHYGVDFIKSTTVPVWPNEVQFMSGENVLWNRDKIDEYLDMWAALAQVYGVGVICGEMGCYHKTPHNVVLAWLEDWMQSLKAHNIGYALWNLVGTFGIIDSDRADVDYKNYNGHLLDEKMLKLLQKY